MEALVFGIVAGGLFSWVIAHFYYRKANHDQNHLFDKLPENIRKILLEDQRVKLSVKELNELIRTKTTDITKKGLEAFKACPKCGSQNIRMGKELYDVDADEGGYYPIYGVCITCENCGWQKFEGDDLEL